MQYLTPLLYFIAFTFVASILVLIPKVLFFRKQPYAYAYILKHTVVAIIFGIVLAYASYVYFKQRYIDDEGETLYAVIFCCMIIGLMAGSIRMFFSSKTRKDEMY
jgi:hypothetical protein